MIRKHKLEINIYGQKVREWMILYNGRYMTSLSVTFLIVLSHLNISNIKKSNYVNKGKN